MSGNTAVADLELTKKDKWYDDTLLVSPLRGDCESHFKYDTFGKISPTNNGDAAAAETISRLGLADSSLIELRRQAIETALFRNTHQTLSAQQLGKIVQSYCTRDQNQNFRAFCFVVVQAAQQLLRQAERRRKSKQYSRKQGHK